MTDNDLIIFADMAKDFGFLQYDCLSKEEQELLEDYGYNYSGDDTAFFLIANEETFVILTFNLENNIIESSLRVLNHDWEDFEDKGTFVSEPESISDFKDVLTQITDWDWVF